MAYRELIKNFGRVREALRQFYVYGLKSRLDFPDRSPRSYDDERRRLESWLGEYLCFRRDSAGKVVYLSVDSRAIPANPLYQALKAKSFTPLDILFHFCVLDALADGRPRSAAELTEALERCCWACGPGARSPDESGIRKKLREYERLGLVRAVRQGRELRWTLNGGGPELTSWAEALAFFSETAPLGVLGSCLLDRLPGEVPRPFRFKHHYILHALDSEILCQLLLAMDEGRWVDLEGRAEGTQRVWPYRIFLSTQSGRQYLLCWHEARGMPRFFRLDHIHAVKPGPEERSGVYATRCARFREKLWGVSLGEAPGFTHLEMTLRLRPGEEYVAERLERERRCGRVEVLGEGRWRFTADVYDAAELLPWLRTFLGRVESLQCSDARVTRRFYEDYEALARMYAGVGKEEAGALS